MLTIKIGGRKETGDAHPTVMAFDFPPAATVRIATGSGNWLE